MNAQAVPSINASTADAKSVLEVRGLTKHFVLSRRWRGPSLVVHAVDNVNLHLDRGETLGLVGESGSGKTTVGRCVLRLIEPTAGEIHLEGQDITRLGKKYLRVLRRKMQMVFQDPADSLNPRFTLRRTLVDALQHAGIHNPKKRVERAVALVEQVGMETGDLDKFPHQFSGGQQQRIAIARALAFDPVLLVLDEPTASLDVSVQAQITNLLRELQAKMGHSYVLISHNLSNVRHVTNRVAVMYLGQLVETGDTRTIFDNPQHPYTRVLIDSVPIPDPTVSRQRRVLSGEIPSPINPPPGCRFHSRCPEYQDICSEVEPELVRTADGHAVACHHCKQAL